MEGLNCFRIQSETLNQSKLMLIRWLTECLSQSTDGYNQRDVSFFLRAMKLRESLDR